MNGSLRDPPRLVWRIAVTIWSHTIRRTNHDLFRLESSYDASHSCVIAPPTTPERYIVLRSYIYIYRSQYSGVKRIYCSSRIENGFDFVLLQLVQKCFLLTNAPTRVVTLRYVRDLAISDFRKRCFLWSTLLFLGTEFSSMFYES